MNSTGTTDGNESYPQRLDRLEQELSDKPFDKIRSIGVELLEIVHRAGNPEDVFTNNVLTARMCLEDTDNTENSTQATLREISSKGNTEFISELDLGDEGLEELQTVFGRNNVKLTITVLSDLFLSLVSKRLEHDSKQLSRFRPDMMVYGIAGPPS